MVHLGQAWKVTLVESVGGWWVIPPLVPKNLFKDAKKLSLSFLQESISYTLVIVKT